MPPVLLARAEGGRAYTRAAQPEEARRERGPAVREGQRWNISVQPRAPASVQAFAKSLFSRRIRGKWRPVGRRYLSVTIP